MIISLNENELAERMIFQKEHRNYKLEEIRLIARYYIDMGFNGVSLYDKVKSFILSCDPDTPITSVRWDNIITSAITKAKLRPAITTEYITITDAEMNDIESLSSVRTQRLYFTLLCLAKYWNIVRADNNNWVFNKDSEIMKLANVSDSIKKQSALYRELELSGLVYFPKKVNSTSMRIDGVKDGETIMKIDTFKNLGYQLLEYHGGPFFKCQNCGVTTKITNPDVGRQQKYCKACAVKIRTKQTVDSIISRRMQLKELNC